MANVKFSRKIFEKEIGKLDEKMQNKIAMFSTPVESVTDEEIELEIFPDRPDLLSYHGFKRSFLSFLGKKPGLKKYPVKKPEKNYKVFVENSVSKIRPFTACAVVKGLELDDEKIKEIIDLQEKLHNTIGRKRKKLAIGIYPLEKITMPITYKALEPDKIKFIPLEMSKELNGLQILQRHPTGREYSHLLSGKSKFPVFIDSAGNILSMPPIINSQLTGKITKETKDVFVECSGFDLKILKKCLNIIATSLSESSNAKIFQIEVKYKKTELTPDLTPEKKKISLDNTNTLLGLNLNEQQLKKYLEKMGYNYNKGTAEIPAWRMDILHEVDLIEDVAIAYGYDRFNPKIPEISGIGEESKKESIRRKISCILAGLGMLEVSNYHLTSKKNQFDKMGLSDKQKRFIEVKESKTEYNILRENLSHYVLKNLSENIDAEYPQKVFEIGTVFNPDLTESVHLCSALAPGNFTEIKQALEYFSRMVDKPIQLKEPEKPPAWFIDGRTAEILLENKKTIGFIGEIHPKILKNWKIKMPVSLFEINLDYI